MAKWICEDCGYEYDSELGDPSNKIPPGTPFDELPEDWECPDCGAPQDAFAPAE